MNAKKATLALLALAVSLTMAPQAQALEARPAWKLVVTPMPTVFAPGSNGTALGGPQYLLTATNVGAASTTSEPVELSATLPEGIVPIEAKGTRGGAGAKPTCGILAQTVSCETAVPLDPGRFLGAQIVVDVAASAAGTLGTEASIAGGGTSEVHSSAETQVGPETASFGFLTGAAGLSAPLTGPDGSASTQAGSHPDQLTVDFGFSTERTGAVGLTNAGHPRDLSVDLPRGEIVDPTATPVLCTEAQLTGALNEGAAGTGCPPASQIGTVAVASIILSGPAFVEAPLYNMVAPPGTASNFGFEALGIGIYVHLIGGVRSDSDYGLSATTADIAARRGNPILSIQAQLWGDTAAHSHDQVRGQCLFSGGSCEVKETTGKAFLTVAGDCPGQPAITKAHADSWEEPGTFEEASYESADLGGAPVSSSGCNQLSFEPTIEAKPTTNLADSPSGLDFSLHQPQETKLSGLSTASMKDAVVTLPEGMAVNPSSAEGQGACTEAELGVSKGKEAAHCPDSSKLGTVEVTTPLLDHPLSGALYLAKPFQNPTGSLIAIYLTVHDSQTGVVAKLTGKVEPDPVTGQLRTRFTENPELPIEDVRLHLFTGPRASLRTPTACATYATTTEIVPWSFPEGADAQPSDSFAIVNSPDGGTCPSSAAGAPNAPTFTAGTIAPAAATYSPFVFKVTRPDGSQPLERIDATLAPGLTGKLAGIPYCSEAQIAQAQGRNKPNEGALEQASPSCPAGSEVGTVDVGAGAGITPLHVQGHAYLAGPYKGAPLSLAIVTPAVAGPFDLGAVVVRTALYLNSETAQIHAVSDPLPQILDGIPLDVRSVSLTMGRPEFTLNPTSCDPMSIDGTITSALGQSTALTSPFQVGGCSTLAFKPKLAIRLKGATKRTGHPALTAVATFTKGQANTKRVSVTLPRSEFLDQGHIGTVCTRVQFAANECPKASVYGKARATTPLLDKPLSGPVYLRSSSHELPDLVVALHGQVDVVLDGRVDSINGGIRNTFEAAPDAPVSKFVLEMQGGKKGLLINSANLCKLKPAATKAVVKMEAQNGKVWDTEPVVKNSCKHGRHGKHKKHRGAR